MLQAILFDLDMTLVDTYDMWMNVLKHLSDKRIRTGDIHKKDNWGRTHEEFARELAEINDLDWKQVSSMAIAFISDYRKLKFREKDFLSKIKTHCKIGIITGNTKTITDIYLQNNPEIDFEIVLTGDDMGQNETKKELIERAVHELGVVSDETAYVGDHPCDIIASKKAGVESVAIVSRMFSRKELSKYEPGLIIENLSELTQYHPEISSGS